jgi:hypothetical protein
MKQHIILLIIFFIFFFLTIFLFLLFFLIFLKILLVEESSLFSYKRFYLSYLKAFLILNINSPNGLISNLYFVFYFIFLNCLFLVFLFILFIFWYFFMFGHISNFDEIRIIRQWVKENFKF